MGKRLRFSRVPWLTTESDLRPMGEPETTVECGATIAHGLFIPYPFGRGTDAILTVIARRGNGNDGGVIGLAITGEVYISSDVTLISGTDRRTWVPGEDDPCDEAAE